MIFISMFTSVLVLRCLCCVLVLAVCGLLTSVFLFLFFFKQKTAYEMRISDWSSDVCSSDLCRVIGSQLGNRGIVIFLLHVVMTAGQGNRGHSHCEVSGNGTHSHLTLHAPVSVLGESPRYECAMKCG